MNQKIEIRKPGNILKLTLRVIFDKLGAMKLYEIHTILKPSLDETAVNNIIADLGTMLAQNGFGISSSQTRPNEYLTYPIKHFKEGHLVNIEISGPEEAVLPAEVETKIKNNEHVLRHLIFAKSAAMLKKNKPFPVFDQNRGHRTDRRPATPPEPASTPRPAPQPAAPVDIEEVDRKLEELLK